MTIVNIHHAKTHLSKLVARAAEGEPFIIARAGEPLVQVTAVARKAAPRRLGFLQGAIEVPDDFNTMGESEMEALFGFGPQPEGEQQ